VRTFDFTNDANGAINPVADQHPDLNSHIAAPQH